MGAKGWSIFAVVALALLGGLIYLSGQNKANIDGVDALSITTASENNGNIAEHTRGNPDGKVLFMEYADYQCPGCGSAYPRIKILADKYADQVTFVFRNFPLTSAHPNSRVAAASAEAAGLQGKFWEMNDLIFVNQNVWSGASTSDRGGIFRDMANRLGLDLEKFDADIASDAVSRKINFDIALGKSKGVTATPTFYIGSTKLEQDVWGDDAKLEAALRDAITAAGLELPPEETSETPAPADETPAE